MKKKIVLLLLLFVGICLLADSCSLTGGAGLAGGVPGSGNIRTEIRETGAFEAIAIEYPAEVLVRQGPEETVQIQADDNLLPQLATEVLSGRLTIKSLETGWKDSVNPSAPVKIAITVNRLDEIEVSAPVGELEVNDLQTGTLKLVLSGGAEIRLNGIQVDLLDGVLSGAGAIHVSGTADEIKLVHSGLGSFDAGGMECREANIELSGMGDATVRVQEELAASITGAGSVRYYGHPHVEEHLDGAGSVQPAE